MPKIGKNTKVLYKQGAIHFLLHDSKDSTSHAYQYFRDHGEGISKICFGVDNAEASLEEACKRGAKCIQDIQEVQSNEDKQHTNARYGSIQGLGDIRNEFLEAPKGYSYPGLDPIKDDQEHLPLSHDFARVDHFTNNVSKGRKWIIGQIFINKFMVLLKPDTLIYVGQKTGLQSKVCQLANGQVIIPINEPKR